jgi:glycine cleavage system H lipoate-binding protein
MSHEFLSIYPAKLMEYCLAIGYLLLFIPFWRYVQGGPRATAARKAAAEGRAATARPAGATAPAGLGWFQLPAGLKLHPGHTWARLEQDGLVTVGIDDFAHRLVGPASVELPAVGDHVSQGDPALALRDEGRSVDLLSPVDGTVLAVNPALAGGAAALDDPYGAGWLFKVKPARLAANLRQLHGPAAARRMLDDASEALLRRMDPELGRVLQDGGAPVHGIARALAGDGWEEFAREFFLT